MLNAIWETIANAASPLLPASVYSPPSSAGFLPEHTSPIYPDRPIRPLPKKPLKSRLSPEVADTIHYPQTPKSRPLFSLPQNRPTNYPEKSTASAKTVEPLDLSQQIPSVSRELDKEGYRFKGNDVESDEEDGVGIMRRYQEQRSARATDLRGFSYDGARADTAKYPRPPNLQSTTSSAESVDGYDSFENTNNKKKRKIPTSGNIGNYHSSLSATTAEMASLGIDPSLHSFDSAQDHDGGVSQYYGSGSSAISAAPSGTGLSGAGRGRFGRSGIRHPGGRSPLGVSTNGSNALNLARSTMLRREPTNSDTRNGADQGIISAAIANAAALPTTPCKGQENVSLLEQQSAKLPSSTKTQFTFTCESDSSKGMAWSNQQSPTPPGMYQAPVAPNVVPPLQTQGQRGLTTQGTQTSPTMANQTHQNLPGQSAGQQNPAPRKPRRSAAKQYAIAARQRRLQQEYKNYNHPPKPEEVWICEFCEYEAIFGTPPEALIRQYEIKDRRERRRLAEKRRLLEKAKMKGKKGKKGNKNASKHAATQPQHSNHRHHYDQQPTDQVPVQHQGTQSEEYLHDDYDEDPMPALAPLPQTPSKIPQPIAHQYNTSMRSAVGDGGRAGAGRAA